MPTGSGSEKPVSNQTLERQLKGLRRFEQAENQKTQKIRKVTGSNCSHRTHRVHTGHKPMLAFSIPARIGTL